jgi:hypothetical protein
LACPRGVDELDDDKDEGWAGIGTGLKVVGAPQASDDKGVSEQTDSGQGEEDQEPGTEGEGGGWGEGEGESQVNVMDRRNTYRSALECPKTLQSGCKGDVRDKPIFGICMGHQVISMAARVEACRMTFGNRGHNQPVLAFASSGGIKAGRVYVNRWSIPRMMTGVASRTHSVRFSAVKTLKCALKLQDPFPDGWESFFINYSNSPVDGIKSTTVQKARAGYAVPFRRSGGPLDTIGVGSHR